MLKKVIVNVSGSHILKSLLPCLDESLISAVSSISDSSGVSSGEKVLRSVLSIRQSFTITGVSAKKRYAFRHSKSYHNVL